MASEDISVQVDIVKSATERWSPDYTVLGENRRKGR